MKRKLLTSLLGLAMAGSVVAGAAGCASESVANGQTTVQEVASANSGAGTGAAVTVESDDSAQADETAADSSSDADSTTILSSSDNSVLDVTEMFTDRDLEQSPSLDDAASLSLTSGNDVTINDEGIYVLSGDVTNVTVEVDAGDEASVQLVLDGVSIVNDSSPAISVVSADKVFVTLTDSENHLEVSGAYADDSLDAVIFSRSDLVLNGTGSLELVSAQGNGVTSKDDLKITGGTYHVTSALDGFEANDSIGIYDGNMTVVSAKDAFHAENTDDTSLGYIYMANGTLTISAASDGLQGNAIVQIDGGVIDIETCAEGIEGTYVQINGGEISIYATDDGINASEKSGYDVVIEINGGTISIDMAGGDTDALDANGDIYINGGTLNLTGNSIFDYYGVGELNGGEVIVNGSAVTQLTQSQMGGGGGPAGATGTGGMVQPSGRGGR